ncbi:YdcF family protein [Jeotgalibaca ciconiae]|uniref:YdcF family protein n=1 Tax=Jeotgalibaca ciconiae TaxID=2496265 RepID=A0A3S9H9X4_9LACT|nr:YdcF family protein [Jeotgalibaca ciconiae]AZP04145.1 YdcF family protein [Jeotgalibaca ciconiae]
MIFYVFSMLSLFAFIMLSLKQKHSQGKIIFLFGAGLAVFFGIIQRRAMPMESVVVRWAILFMKFIYSVAPYFLGLFSMITLVHAVQRLQKRRKSRKYLALVALSFLLLFLVVIVIWNKFTIQLRWIHSLEYLLAYVLIYMVFSFLLFVISVIIHQFKQIQLSQDYLIVLGTGILPDGTVSKILQYRLDKALSFYKKQKEQGEEPVTLIVSGGKGPDAPQSEAEVMKQYLIQKGMDPQNIIAEMNSVNTHQNFLFSKNIITKKKIGDKGVFVTNSFHILRSSLYARQLGVDAIGIGAKTPWHYLPYALVREYIALLLIYRHFHIATALLFLGIALILR